jgi:hypothetical protein
MCFWKDGNHVIRADAFVGTQISSILSDADSALANV